VKAWVELARKGDRVEREVQRIYTQGLGLFWLGMDVCVPQVWITAMYRAGVFDTYKLRCVFMLVCVCGWVWVCVCVVCVCVCVCVCVPQVWITAMYRAGVFDTYKLRCVLLVLNSFSTSPERALVAASILLYTFVLNIFNSFTDY
jgi:hypothetical protein